MIEGDHRVLSEDATAKKLQALVCHFPSLVHFFFNYIYTHLLFLHVF